MTVPKFAKNPRLIIGVLVGLWLAYLIDANLDQAVVIALLPWVKFQFRLSLVIVVCIVFGALATLFIQYLWRKRHASKASE